jgi:magnesium chelatase subunit I
VQREAIDKVKHVSFTLVGTMNPEEGGLRPQLLDRFGLMVSVSELPPALRREMLLTVLRFDQELREPTSDWIAAGRDEDRKLRLQLKCARRNLRLHRVELLDSMAELCADIATEFQSIGHRGEIVIALAARARAALEGVDKVEPRHVREVAPMALQHRRPETVQGGRAEWTKEDSDLLDVLIAGTDHQ